jgi:preprotein translocase subunit SecB
MTESPTNDQTTGANGAANGAPGTTQRVFGLRQLYVKDLSFESPNTPAILTETGLDPEIKLNLRTSHRDLGNGLSEVVLHVSVHAMAGQRTVFLIELEQAGTFVINGFSPEEVRAILGISCPNALFPYARETISSAVQRGGFSPLLLQPIDFTALVAKAQGQASTPIGASPAGRA